MSENPNRGLKQVEYNNNNLGLLSLNTNSMDSTNLNNFNDTLEDLSWKVGNKYTVVKPNASGDIRDSLILADQTVTEQGGYIYIPQTSADGARNREFKLSGRGRTRIVSPVVCDAENVTFDRSADIQFGDFVFGPNSKFTLTEGVQIVFSGSFSAPENKEVFNTEDGGDVFVGKTKNTLNHNNTTIPNNRAGRVIYEINPTLPAGADLDLYLLNASKTGHITYVFYVTDNHSYRVTINPEAGSGNTLKGLDYIELFANDRTVLESNGENYI